MTLQIQIRRTDPGHEWKPLADDGVTEVYETWARDEAIDRAERVCFANQGSYDARVYDIEAEQEVRAFEYRADVVPIGTVTVADILGKLAAMEVTYRKDAEKATKRTDKRILNSEANLLQVLQWAIRGNDLEMLRS